MWSLAVLLFLGSACHLTVGIRHENLVRKNVEKLSTTEILNLQVALDKLEHESGPSGYQVIAGYHGAPPSCEVKGQKTACCIHGMPTFPAWHRLYVVQMERALARQGMNTGMPYWDYTRPLSHLPSLVQNPVFIDPQGGKAKTNSWYEGAIDHANTHTARAVDDRLFETVGYGQHTELFDHVLDALEQDEYCQFEIQLEVSHNSIHLLTGGRYWYSMSSLEYTSYDPLFFLYHSNVDRIFAIWQELQKARGKPWDSTNCGIHMFKKPLEPFNRPENTDPLTKAHSTGAATFDYHQLGYSFDDLTINDLNSQQLLKVLEERKSGDRLFASFQLHGVGISANVHIYLCLPSKDENSPDHCEFSGDFFILGGPTEMPWTFAFPYYFDVTKTLSKFPGADASFDFYAKAEVTAVNGTLLPEHSLPDPKLVRKPGTKSHDESVHEGKDHKIRKNIETLTLQEQYDLRKALTAVQKDKSSGGFQTIASYHGQPIWCPTPDAKKKYACCVHGMATFPHWHRLITVQFENALRRHGYTGAVPYWDWTKPISALPALAKDAKFKDPFSGETVDNSWYKAYIDEAKTETARAVGDKLFAAPKSGHRFTDTAEQVLLALEQDNFCDFEVQYEIIHNMIHAEVGGPEKYSMGSLRYTAYDPIFFLHHSMTDKLWAIWQALQKERGKPYNSADCAAKEMRKPLQPFGQVSVNPDHVTRDHAVPISAFDYKDSFGYEYDDLQFNGMSINQLEKEINHMRAKKRVFAGFYLHGIKHTAMVSLKVCRGSSEYDCKHASEFYIFGDEYEMPWKYDRIYKHDITEALAKLELQHDDDFHIKYSIVTLDGKKLGNNLFGKPVIIRDKGTAEEEDDDHLVVRKDVSKLTPKEQHDLRHALQAFKADKTTGGFQAIAAYHGQPQYCPTPEAKSKFACCVHGMATFPHWHRLITVQFENGLRRHGYSGAVPYWDWTQPHTNVPFLTRERSYTNPYSGELTDNSWYNGHIDEANTVTTRSVHHHEEGEESHNTYLLEQTLLALEQEDFCDFEIQFEVLHNAIHLLIGGKDIHSMANLRYTAYDPIFYLHHSMIDKLWAIWQAVQKHRGKPYNSANCAQSEMQTALHPFDMAGVNPDPVTRKHAIPNTVFDYKNEFHYKYDNLEFNGMSIPELSKELYRRRARGREFAGFMLHGIGKSAKVKFDICPGVGHTNCKHAGEFYILGDKYEMPWSYERYYKYEITDALADMNIHHYDAYHLVYTVYDREGHKIGNSQFGTPLVIHVSGEDFTFEDQLIVRKSVDSLSPKETNQLRKALAALKEDKTNFGFQTMAAYHGQPIWCPKPTAEKKYACCVHGMPTFPHWHRLITVQFENGLKRHGYTGAVPYWDWTVPHNQLPDLARDPKYTDPVTGDTLENSWYKGHIDEANAETVRSIDDALFQKPSGHYTRLAQEVLLALEQDDFCDFEVHFEIVHNMVHALLGGPEKFSMSSLRYTAYDPIFFLHHSMTDKIWAIWQALQKQRGKAYNSADCALSEMQKKLQPFGLSREVNPDPLTRGHAVPLTVFDYKNSFGYKYDNLEFNGLSVEQLSKEIDRIRSKERFFAGFKLHGIKCTAQVHYHICAGTSEINCKHGGEFYIFGDEYEMPWTYSRVYKQDITDVVHEMGFTSEDPFHVVYTIYALDGTELGHDQFGVPEIIHDMGTAMSRFYHRSELVTRKDIAQLTENEVYELREAMDRWQHDLSVVGYQAISEYHGEPARCPRPDAAVRWACCHHGMPTFPHWHRVFMAQMEDELVDRDSPIGVPYWDWSLPMTELPKIVTDETYTTANGEVKKNPFYKVHIEHVDKDTTRNVVTDLLFEKPKFGDHTYLFDAMIFAFEQEDFCDFEVQFEVIHNAVHLWVGGDGLYSMAHLHYTSYDPIFYLHHSNVDRLWVIWQELQKMRGKPYVANCAKSEMSKRMTPFSFKPPLNNNVKTRAHSLPNTLYDYEHLGYQYDALQFGGMNIHDLEAYIQLQKKKDRTFAGFQLGGIKTSANVDVFVNGVKAGTFSILGGEKEMPWSFDRPYMFEITNALVELGLKPTDDYSVTITIKEYNGNDLDSNLIPEPLIIFKPGIVDVHEEENHSETRKNVDMLSPQEVYQLRRALASLQEDKTHAGFQTIAAYHGQPYWCPSPDAEKKYACCIHGMAVFPHWHRLLTVQFENGLRRHGYTGAVPYWDWSRPLTELPALVKDPTYKDPITGEDKPNSWFKAHIDEAGVDTERSIVDRLFEKPAMNHYTNVAQQMLLALEQDNFCDFEVQYEVAHNLIHALVGGDKVHSMGSLRYTAYDPIFFLHHSMTDKVWAIWQALQRYRGKPYNIANCALSSMWKPLQPFGLSSYINPDQVTRDHSLPALSFDYKHHLGYDYDNLDFNGLSVQQLEREFYRRRLKERVFAGFLLYGIKNSAMIKFKVCAGANCKDGGEFYLLGDEYEMPWKYDRTFKYEITDLLHEMNLRPGDDYHITYTIYALDGTDLGSDKYGTPTIIYDRGAALFEDEYTHPINIATHVRKDIYSLNDGEIESLRAAFNVLHRDGTYENIAKTHGHPGLCDGLACCVHGMPTFPHWHRVYVVQVAIALLQQGSATPVPYWDWTSPLTEIPKLLSDATFYNSREQRYDPNPFFSGKISDINQVTSRAPKPELFHSNYFYENTLLAFEQDNFCDFEIQFEVTHNAFHLWLGGRDTYSMSTLDFSAFDPAFFVYHANTDRLWAIWQELQRYRKKPYNSADCAINLMHVPLRPFNGPDNKNPITRKASTPFDVFDYQNNLKYTFDTLIFNNLTIPDLEDILIDRKKHDRVFVGVMLHGVKSSAQVTIYVCVPVGTGKKNCNNKAGVFCLLGGPLEMPFTFDRLFKYDITDTLLRLGMDLQSHAFDIKLHVETHDGRVLPSDTFGEPTIMFVPGTETRQTDDGRRTKYAVRKNINHLSPKETLSLVKALRSMQADSSADGFQTIASFHALPPLCPSPTAAKRYACCVHGMATFPQWHRLHMVQFGESLMKHGTPLCVPYWVWSRPQSALPELLTKDSFTDPETGEEISNPWKVAHIDFENADTTRDLITSKLFPPAKGGYKTWYYDQVMYALEQENFCDFEVQFEVMHNGIHLWMGGNEEYSMSHLNYTSYDPAFYVHHSECDRIWAIWQELQKYRGLDGNEANCALEMMKVPLKPFNFGPPYNLNKKTSGYSKPADAFNYREHYGYEYDSLEFMGMTIPMLDTEIKKIQHHDRVFAGFLLAGFKKSANVDFQVCDANNKCEDAGYFSILGGLSEMPWHYDRLYKYDITETMKKLGLHHDDPFTIKPVVTHIHGTVLEGLIGTPSTIFVPGKDISQTVIHTSSSVRRDINSLDERAKENLISSLNSLQLDSGNDGFDVISSFHGLPAKCPDPNNPEYACCIHGMPSFPQWHRLYVRQFELALKRHGSINAVPYWDWTLPVKELPSLVTQPSYYDAMQDKVIDNPWSRGIIPTENSHTVRDLQPDLFRTTDDGKYSLLFEQVLLALEQTDFCDFEVQLEVIHNWIHNLVGGRQEYSMASLHWTSYDPFFYIHHSFVDKLFAVWQELQKRRHLPHDRADCAFNLMNTPMQPFNLDINANPFIKAHSKASDCFEYVHLGYSYDNFNVGGYDLDQLEDAIERNKHKTRVFAGFLLFGIGTSAEVHFDICKSGDHCTPGGMLFILGGSKEMPWAYDRLFKYDITEEIAALGIDPIDLFHLDEAFHLKVVVKDMSGNEIAGKLPEPTLIYQPAEGASAFGHEATGSEVGVRKDVDDLSVNEIKNLRKAMAAVMADTGPNGFQAIASYHGSPPICDMPDGKNLSCCIHGMATFPHWHRLHVKQMEDALVSHGAVIGMPYWDWTKSFTKMPAFVTDDDDNPFLKGKIEYLGKETTRNPKPQLFSDPEKGEESFFYRQMLLAFEQIDYCAFEVQFEVTHNAIHSWTGGHDPYSMSTLDFTSYDPLFYLVHSSVDRIWAIWQALQLYRGRPYNQAYCEIQDLKEPLRPFSDSRNPNPETRKHSTAFDSFNYKSLNYQYDNLKFHGLSIPDLEEIIHEQQRHDRIFVDFLLRGFKKSADVEFDICTKDHSVCKFGGTFALLGGPYEMEWAFDRLFRYDVTKTMNELGLRHDSDLDIVVRVFYIDGTQLDSSLINPPTLEFVPAKTPAPHLGIPADKIFRKEINTLTLDEISQLRNALFRMQNDGGKDGFEHISGFHGAPYMCPENGDTKYACCMHGMAVFPHWHRLFTVQYERALIKHGSSIGVPYWDWTKPFTSIPSFFGESTNSNPFYKYHIGSLNEDIRRDLQDEMYQTETLYNGVLEVLGEDNYCDFEVQYEILHNLVHFYIGGSADYSMSTLEFSAFDPFFMIHHSAIDRIWIIWQELQRLRNKPFNVAPCAGSIMHMPLHPFSYASVNGDDFTLKHSDPDTVFDHEQFDYWYDSMSLHDQSLEELHTSIKNLRHSPRTYAGFVLSGVKDTVVVNVWMANGGHEEKVGHFIIFGGKKEIPWAYERIYKMDVTDIARKLNLNPMSGDPFTVRTEAVARDGTPITHRIFPDALLVYRPSNSDQDIIIVPIGKDKSLPPKITVKRDTYIMFQKADDSITSVIDLGSYTTFYNCIVPPFGLNTYDMNRSYRLEPGDHFFTAASVEQCQKNQKIEVHVDDY